jgi:hypothetical protein
VIPQWLLDLMSLPTLAAGGSGATALGLVGAKFHRLDREVKECRARDSRFVVIEAGFRMVVGEMQRENPNSIALQMCGDLLNRKLGPAPSMGDLTDLLKQLDDIT